jgi:phenylpropionate dioxygenase-like ring-hydroxylating dioxygenase large terminal subunit
MSQETLVSRPASGHWTDAYPALGRGPVSLEDCVSPEFYEKEREHVFSKTWLYVGRVERVPHKGSYFTRELRFLNTSIIIVRGKDDVIRAFHNICPHRGKQDAVGGRSLRRGGWPRAIAVLPLSWLAVQAGRARCIRPPARICYSTSTLTVCRVPAIQCEVWEGFIFVNLNPHNTEPAALLPW